MAQNETEEIRFLELLASFFRTLKQNTVIAILLPLAGVLLGVGLTFTSKQKFESKLLIETSLLSANECKTLLYDLEKSSWLPGLTLAEKRVIKKFEYAVTQEPLEPGSGLKDNSINLEITATTSDSLIFPVLEKKIMNYLSNTRAVARNRKEKERFYRGMIARIDSEMAGLDDIKKEINNREQATFLNPSDLYAHSVALFKDKTHYEIKLEEIKDIHLIKGFDFIQKSKINEIFGAMGGFVLGAGVLFLILFIRFFRQNFLAPEPNA